MAALVRFKKSVKRSSLSARDRKRHLHNVHKTPRGRATKERIVGEGVIAVRGPLPALHAAIKF
jgi:hypothetical protein